MVLRCAAKGCHTKHDGSIEQSFFKFPKQNLKLRQQWLDLLDIPDFVPKPTSSVCWKHFHPSAMKIKWNPNRDKNIRPRRRLVINAVPDYQGPYENQGTETSIWPDETCCLPTIPNDTEEPLEAEESEIFLPSGDAQDEEIMRLKKQAHRLQVAIKRRERRIQLIKKDHQIRSDLSGSDIPPYRKRKLESINN
ncbi:THAP domain-containing protein 1-like isoform X2 [Tigriopus californicus]|uniref:THAP domain-containing protein 1-like isoform X2 n=1 Tax=Tigriopus californicus TaxID=6832 RepID=UPI0027DAAF09|nr:THAP domain-containing protein 1-like isoform X2 [Tigriopus californicus]